MLLRIPTSTIVMSLVAAIPFGLAIRDTVLHHDKLHELADEERLAAERARTEAAQELATQQAYVQQLAAERQAREDRVRELARELVGHDFVTPGPAFHGQVLGQPKLDGTDAISDAAGNVLAMSAKMADDDIACSTLRDVAAKTWGEPATDRVWLDLRTHQRASITSDCALEFGRFADAAAWVKALPLDAVGRSRAELAHKFASHDDVDLDAAWVAPGLDGDAITQMWPVYEVEHPDKLVGLQISTTATRATIERVAQELATRMHAKPVKSDDAYTWRQPAPMRLELDDDKLVIELGPDAVR
jgi:hypothetical protein